VKIINAFRKIQGGVCLLPLVCALFAVQFCANPARADLIVNDGLQAMSDDGTSGMPGSAYSGWFFNPQPNPALPTQPDLSQPWTSTENVATMNYWLSLVVELGDSSDLVTQLTGLAPTDSLGSALQLIQTDTQAAVSNTPEPVTWPLLAGGLLFLGLFAQVRVRRINRRDGVHDDIRTTCRVMKA
jgi:hypothetical protein